MDAKVTLSFDRTAISSAKKFAEERGISLSRLTEYLYKKIASSSYNNLEELPVSQWVNMLAEGEAEYKTKKRTRSDLKKEYFKNRK